MPRITMALEPADLDAMRQVIETILLVATNPSREATAELGRQIAQQMDTADPGVLLALSDQAATMLVLAQNAIHRRGGVEVLADATVQSGKAVWADAPTEA